MKHFNTNTHCKVIGALLGFQLVYGSVTAICTTWVLTPSVYCFPRLHNFNVPIPERENLGMRLGKPHTSGTVLHTSVSLNVWLHGQTSLVPRPRPAFHRKGGRKGLIVRGRAGPRTVKRAKVKGSLPHISG